jgi:hypothetical protein
MAVHVLDYCARKQIPLDRHALELDTFFVEAWTSLTTELHFSTKEQTSLVWRCLHAWHYYTPGCDMDGLPRWYVNQVVQWWSLSEESHERIMYLVQEALKDQSMSEDEAGHGDRRTLLRLIMSAVTVSIRQLEETLADEAAGSALIEHLMTSLMSLDVQVRWLLEVHDNESEWTLNWVFEPRTIWPIIVRGVDVTDELQEIVRGPPLVLELNYATGFSKMLASGLPIARILETEG